MSIFFSVLELNFDWHISTKNSKYSSAPHSPEGGGRNGTNKIEVRWVRASRLARVALRSVGGLCNGGRQQQSPPLPTTIWLQYQVSCGRKLVFRSWILIEITLF
jgi:hypothetical protein